MRLPVGFVLASGFVLGVALSSSGLFLPVLIFVAGVVGVSWIWAGDRQMLALGAAFLVIAGVGAARVQDANPYPLGPSELESATGFTGVVIDVPRRYPTATYTRFDLDEPARTRAWAQLPAYPVVHQGDVLEVAGVFHPNDRTSFRGFAARRDTTGVLLANTIRIADNRASTAQRWRTGVAAEISGRLRSRIPEPAGAFSTGVILGDDGAMTDATRDAFRVGGMTHMTAVSGIHVGIIAGAILLLSRLGLVSRWWMLGLSLPVIWSFAYLVGMRPSVVRAGLMLSLLIVANLLGRPRDTLNAVGLAAAIMLLIDPSFRYDVGFQLSVAATTGIALGILLVGHRSHWHLLWVVPVAAQLSTEPLILYHFGYYSLVSPLANIVAAPFLAITMAMSISTVLASLVSTLLADALAIATWLPAYSVVLIADTAASVPYLSDDVRPIGLAAVWSAYAVLGGFVAALFVFLEPVSGEMDDDFSLLYRV